MEEREFYERLADLAIRVGVNLQPGQKLFVVGEVDHAPLVRATMEAGWRAGASDVLHYYREPYDRLFLGRYGTDEQLERSHVSELALVDDMANQRPAIVAIIGEADPDLYSTVDPAKLARIRPVEFYRRQEVISTRQGIAWTLIPFPTAAWAARIFGEPDLERLRDVISRSVRLDEPDPIAAWQAHAKELRERAELLTSSGYDGVRFRGPGTDLFVGLVPGAVWGSVPEMKTAWGQRHCANMPTEEVATTPDCMRTSGVVTTTLPFADVGAYVTGARLRFEDGRVVDCSAEEGEAWLKQVIETDEGAAMLGEVALVPAENRLSALGMTFFSVLFDENVASHVALGQSYSEGVPGSEDLTAEERRAMGMCQSVIHFDFMIGSSEMDVFGVRKDGTEEPVMVGGRWSGGMRS